MPHLPGGERLPDHVVLAVGRGEDYGAGPGVLEDHPLECREPGRVEVLDNFDNGSRVEVRQPREVRVPWTPEAGSIGG